MVLLFLAVILFMRMALKHGPVTRSLHINCVMLLMMSLLQETWQLAMVLKL
jgi:hypothetical protein